MPKKKTDEVQEQPALKIQDIKLTPGERHAIEAGEQVHERWIEAAFNIVDEAGKVIAERKLAFDPDITTEELEAELQKFLATFMSDAEIGEKTKKVAEENENAIKLAKEFEGKVIE